MKKQVIIKLSSFIFLLVFLVGFSSALTNISTCQTLNSAGETYTLNASITNVSGTCFTVSEDNITINGMGYEISGDDSGTDYGITVTDQENITIQNFKNISLFNYGIYFNSVNSSKIYNNTLIDANQYGMRVSSSRGINISTNHADYNDEIGIYLWASLNCTISKNNATAQQGSGTGIYLYSSKNNKIIENNATHNGNYGIYLWTNSSNNIISDNTVGSSSFHDGIHIYLNSSNNTISNNIIQSLTTSAHCIQVTTYSSYNRIINNTCHDSNFGMVFSSECDFNSIINNSIHETGTGTIQGIGISLGGSSNNTVRSNLVNNSVSGIKLLTNSGDNHLINNDLRGNSKAIEDLTWAGYINYLVYNNSFGEIRWTNFSDGSILEEMNVYSDIILGQTINITSNHISIASGLLDYKINSSANITLYSPAVGINGLEIIRNGLRCDQSTSPSCYNFTSLNVSTVIFNVSGFSNYTINLTDTTVPIITLITPIQATNSTATAYNFTFNITDNRRLISNCSLIIDGVIKNNLSTTVQTPSQTQGIYYSGLTVGSYVWSINCTDYSSNTANSSERSLIIRSTANSPNSGGGGGGGSGFFWVLTKTSDSEKIKQGQEFSLSKKHRIRITVNNENHYVGIIDLTSSSITVNISSTPQQAVLVVGQEKKFEVTDDDYYDLLVKLNSIENNKANITVKEIYEKVPDLGIDNEPSEPDDEGGIFEKGITEVKGIFNKNNAGKIIIISIVCLLIIIILIGIGFYIKKKKPVKKKKKKKK